MAQRIRAFRKLKGFTQDEFARKLGVSIAILGALERGTRKADEKILNKIADTLEIGIHELLPKASDPERK